MAQKLKFFPRECTGNNVNMKCIYEALVSQEMAISVLVACLLILVLYSSQFLLSSSSVAWIKMFRRKAKEKTIIFPDKGVEKDFVAELAVQEEIYAQWGLRLSRRERIVVAGWLKSAPVDWSLIRGGWSKVTWSEGRLYPRLNERDVNLRRALLSAFVAACSYGALVVGGVVFRSQSIAWIDSPFMMALCYFGIAVLMGRCMRPLSCAIELNLRLQSAGIESSSIINSGGSDIVPSRSATELNSSPGAVHKHEKEGR